MIKVNRGNVEIKGNCASVMSEYSVLVRNLHKLLSEHIGAEESRKTLECCFKDAFKTADELEAEIMKLLKGADKPTKALIEAFKEMLEGLEDE